MASEWTAEELRAIEDNYPTHGLSWDGWLQILPGRTAASIQKRANKLGVSMRPEALSELRRKAHGGNMVWVPAEDDALTGHYPTHGPVWEGWRELLPGRSARAISARASALGIRRRPRPKDALSDGQRAYILKGVIAIADGLAVSPVMIAAEIERMRREFENERV